MGKAAGDELYREIPHTMHEVHVLLGICRHGSDSPFSLPACRERPSRKGKSVTWQGPPEAQLNACRTCQVQALYGRCNHPAACPTLTQYGRPSCQQTWHPWPFQAAAPASRHGPLARPANAGQCQAVTPLRRAQHREATAVLFA